MGLKNLSLKTKLTLLSGLFVTGMAVFGLVAFATLNEVKIGGNTYSAISNAYSLDSDYSPPSGYLIGARALIFQMQIDGVKNPSLLITLHQQFEEERKAFEETHDKYAKSMADGQLKDLLQKAYDPGHQYLELAEAKFIPPMLQGKLDEANASRGELETLFPPMPRLTRRSTKPTWR